MTPGDNQRREPPRGRDRGPSYKFTLTVLAAVTVALTSGCVALTIAWKLKADEAACWRQALIDSETIAVAETDCLAR